VKDIMNFCTGELTTKNFSYYNKGCLACIDIVLSQVRENDTKEDIIVRLKRQKNISEYLLQHPEIIYDRYDTKGFKI
jgi:hypothetical protein